MHNGTVADGNKWLSRNLPTILNSAEYRNGSTVVFITWDEGEGGGYASGEHCATNTTDMSCRVATLVISPSTKTGAGPARCSTTTPCSAPRSSSSACPSWARRPVPRR